MGCSCPTCCNADGTVVVATLMLDSRENDVESASDSSDRGATGGAMAVALSWYS
jgi:hypothetical protein